uniref:Bestrophin homolog n=1 Tax=Plectus sambesii TaxID=2011161 RepID=A0A914VQ04_9BILA
MTITYNSDVASSTFIGFTKLCLRWKGSIWKSVWRELAVWCLAYGLLSSVYRFYLTDPQRVIFEDIAAFCNRYSDYIPLTFMLGFFVTIVVGRWWEVFNQIGWIDNPALSIAVHVQGSNQHTRILRRNCIRYLVLTQAMIFRDVCAPVRRRFPTEDTLVAAGFMSENEKKVLDGIVSPHQKYWIPMHWAMALLKQAAEDGHIANDWCLVDVLDRLREFRTSLGSLLCYDWVPVPMAYTQVVHLAVRTYFFISLMGRQYIFTDKRDLTVESPIDLYVPILTIIQFVFFVGWMKVAEALLNPLGDDDDDFECNYILDRNLQLGFTLVDDACSVIPTQEKDTFWDDTFPEPLYSAATAALPMNPLVGSAIDISVPRKADSVMVPRREASSYDQDDGSSFRTDRDDGSRSSIRLPIGRVLNRNSSERGSSQMGDIIKRRFMRIGMNKMPNGATLESGDDSKTHSPVNLSRKSSNSSVVKDINASLPNITADCTEVDEHKLHHNVDVLPPIEEKDENAMSVKRHE